MHRAQPASAPSGIGSIDADILLRALSIFLVVGDHASADPRVGGGAIVLLMLAGLSLARYNRMALVSGEVGGMLKRLTINILLPYYLAVLAYRLWKGVFVPSTLLLVSNWTTDTTGFLVPFWFIGAYTQTMLLFAGLAQLPWFRRAIAEKPWRCGLTVYALSMALMLLCGSLGLSVYGRSLDVVLPLVALGWCIAFADSVARRMIVLLAALAYLAINRGGLQLVLGAAGAGWIENVTLTLAVLAMLFVPRLPLPIFARRIAVAVAAATFTIYLTHLGVIWIAAQVIGHDNPGLWFAVLALVFGVACHNLATYLFRMSRLLRTSRIEMPRPTLLGSG